VGGLVLIPGLLLISGAAPPGAADPATTAPAAIAATAAKAHCRKPHLTWSKASGGATQFGWLLEPGPNGTDHRGALQYVVSAGQVICDSVRLTNPSRHAVTVQLYGADAYNIAADGGFAFTGFNQKPTGVGTWVKLPITRVRVPAGKAADIPIVVQVPANVTPGDTAGGVVARETRVRQGQSVAGMGVGVRAGVGVRVYAQVAGLLHPKLSLTKLTLHLGGGLRSRILGAGTATVSYQVGNTGNVRLSPESSGKLTTRTKTVKLATHQFAELLPGSKPVIVQETVHGLRWGSLIGRVRARVTVTAPGARPVTKEVTAWQTPWLSLIGAGGLVALTAAAGVVGLRRRTPTELEPAAEERDTVGV
jgi:hypothetical protein